MATDAGHVTAIVFVILSLLALLVVITVASLYTGKRVAAWAMRLRCVFASVLKAHKMTHAGRYSYVVLFGNLMAFIKNHRGGWENEVAVDYQPSWFAVILLTLCCGQQQIGDVSVSGFAYHPTLMVLAFQVLAPEALLAFRTFDWVARPYRKRIHGVLNSLFAFFALVGSVIVINLHVQERKDGRSSEKHLASFHAILGLAGWGRFFFCFCFLNSFFFLSTWLNPLFSPR
jgi:hypothetical protein